MIYLDSNATTPIAVKVLQAMRSYFESDFGNPSSGHQAGKPARAAIENARAEVAAAIGAQPNEIVFTSGGTEASNQAIKGTMLRDYSSTADERPHMVISAIEHPATSKPAEYLRRFGIEVSAIGCNSQGVISVKEFAAALRPNTRLASIMHANNEIGSVQPIRELSKICKQRNVLLHVDAAQSLGKIPVNVNELGVDLLSIAGHKIYAPKGVGALYIRQGVEIEPFLHGAGHERGIRSGTENTPYLVGLGQAMSLTAEFISGDGPKAMERLRDAFAAKLQAGIGQEFSVNAADAPRLPNTLSANFPGVIGHELLARCPDVCASTGAACHYGETRRSATLTAIDLPPKIAAGTVRLSLGRGTTADEIDQAAEMLIKAWRDLHGG